MPKSGFVIRCQPISKQRISSTFACAKEHIGFYPTPSAILAFEKEWQPYKTSKGTVRFSFTEPIPYDLIARITAWRLQEVLAKTTTD